MTKKSHSLRSVLAVCLILVFILSACQRPASKAPSIAPDATELPPVPGESIFSGPVTATAIPNSETGGGQVEQPPAATATPETAPQQDVQAGGQQPAAEDVKPTEGNPPATYALQKGEFPFCIARRFNLNQSELLAVNGLTLNSKPGVGAVLKLPQTGNPFVSERSLKSHPTNYTVKAGDTIYTVACQYGDVGPDLIALANKLEAPYTLTAGQVLRIP